MRRARILVVEDERITARDIQAILQGLGHDVPTISATGEDALQKVEALRPDLVLLDIRLRGEIDGITVAEVVRERYRTPVIYLTANADPETVKRARSTEAYGYLLKPFSEQELHTTIQLALYKADAERAHREREEWFRKLVEKSSDIVAVLDADGTVRFVSPPVERILGYRPEELVGRSVLEMIHPEERGQIRESFEDVLTRPEKCIWVEFRSRHRGGGLRILEAQATSYLGDPVIRGVVVNYRDVTGRKAAEEEIRRARDAAERASQAKSELLSRTSHELRTPLNAILGFAQLLELAQLAPEDRESVEQILSAGCHLLALVDEVLDLGAIEAGRMNLSRQAVPVAEVSRQSVEMIRHFAVQRRISVSDQEALGTVHHVWADPQRLKQVVLNMLSNAIKYNRENGSVTLASEETADGWIRIAVRDTGPGIPPEKKERLFVPFERLDADLYGIHGAGLGLALSKGLVEGMGGRIDVDTIPGEGSTFWIELPRADPPAGEAVVGEEQPEAKRTPTVLYIEDNPANLRLVERILSKRFGARLVSAISGSEGLQLARKHRPQLILLDRMLPDMNGDEVLRELQRDPSTRAIPVVVISADAHLEQIGHALTLGASAYLTKPLDIPEFVKVVQGHLHDI